MINPDGRPLSRITTGTNGQLAETHPAIKSGTRILAATLGYIAPTRRSRGGVLYLPEQSRFAKLLRLTEGENLGKAINDAMAAIEEENPALKGVLPRTYHLSRTRRWAACCAR